jgi:hypothetical protein
VYYIQYIRTDKIKGQNIESNTRWYCRSKGQTTREGSRTLEVSTRAVRVSSSGYTGQRPVSPVIQPILSAIEMPSSYSSLGVQYGLRYGSYHKLAVCSTIGSPTRERRWNDDRGSRVDLGNLADTNSDAEDKKCQDNGENLTCGGLEALNRT